MAGTALVLEGGGYRGIYTAGVLDVLMENGVTGFSSVWGTSAGAINAAALRAGQPWRTMRVMLAFRDDPRMMSFRSFVRTGNVTSPDFMYDEVYQRLDPFDEEAFNASDLPVYAVCSDVVFGTAAYLPVRHLPEDLVMIQASTAIAPLSQLVEIDGHRYLDGGTTDSVAFEVALGLEGARQVEGHEPAERAVVVLTRERSFVKGSSNEMFALRSHRYDDFPLYAEALRSRAERYNAQRERLWELERDRRCLVLAPKEPVTVRVGETKGEPLLSLYLAGRADAQERLDEVRAFIGA